MDRSIKTTELIQFIESELGIPRQWIKLRHFTYNYNILGFRALGNTQLKKLLNFLSCETLEITYGDFNGYISVIWKNWELELIKDYTKLLLCDCGCGAEDHGISDMEIWKQIGEDIIYRKRASECTKCSCCRYNPYSEELR